MMGSRGFEATVTVFRTDAVAERRLIGNAGRIRASLRDAFPLGVFRPWDKSRGYHRSRYATFWPGRFPAIP
jgi:hypothetical protein